MTVQARTQQRVKGRAMRLRRLYRRRALWAYLTEHPRATITEIVRDLGYSSRDRAWWDRRELSTLGYISLSQFISRAIQIRLPLWTVSRNAIIRPRGGEPDGLRA